MASYATKLEKFSRNKCCALCTGKVADEVSYGSIYKLGRIEVHYYCLLLSSIVVQKGEDEEGILGFLPNDILEAGKALSQVQCTYCGAKGANVRCAAARCRTVFHYPCGIQNGSFHRFSGRYPSYCSKHRSQQKIPRKIYDLIKAADIECVVCFEKVELDNTMIWAPCCQKSALFHRRCVQRLAISFGSYALKCPLCNNRKKFFDALVDNGIFIPEQDASWEADPEAFLDLLERHNRCDAFRCICMRGREFSQNSYSSMWKIILCTDCGSQGIHRKCIRANIVPRTTLGWKCDVCRVLERVPSEQPTPAIDSYSISSDESDVEVISVQVASTSSSAPVPQLPIQSNPPSSSAPVPQLLIQSNPPSCSAPVPQLLIQSNPPSSSAPVPQFPIQSNLPESTASTVIKEETQQFDESEEENAQQLLLQLPASTSIQRRSLKRSRSPSPGPSQSDTNDERSHHEEKVFICNLDERSFDVAEVEVTTESSEVKEEPSTTTYCGVPLTYCDGPILITDSDDDAAANDTAISIYSDESDDYESDDDAVVEIPFRVDPDIEITVQGGSSRRLRSATARQPCPHQTMVCAHRVPATRSRTRLATSFN